MKTSTKLPGENEPLTKSANEFPVIGVGASAGGLDAFKKLLVAIPENSDMAFVIVQHLDPNHESILPELLQKVTKIKVSEITDEIKVEPNNIYIIPSNKIMIANDGVLKLATRPAPGEGGRNMPIDLFFTSLAEVHQSHSIAVVLSGTGMDGTQGLKAIKDHGGITFAQDEATAGYNGMPTNAVMKGVVDFILPPAEIVEKLVEINKIIHGNGKAESGISSKQNDEDVYKHILSLLRIRKGIDFTYYKKTTIQRRILRRMAISKNVEPISYLKYLRENKPEQDILYQDFLIPVTEFFRDKKSFENLCETGFPQIMKTKTKSEPVRIWVAGCSTGEEAYSIAICFKEFLGEDIGNLQIFASDISEPAIAKARIGVYKNSELENVSAQRLQEFFIKKQDGYQLIKEVRDMCVFAHHNFIKDPPFGKMDLISCRNVLIYMEPYLQKKALTTFHYALNLKGFLLLGKSETVSSVPDLFVNALKSDKLFLRKDVPAKFIHLATQRNEQKLQGNVAIHNENNAADYLKVADDVIRNKYTPAGVIVNEQFDIVNFRGKTTEYLEQTAGKPSHNLLKMARHGLAFELRNILHKAKKENTTIVEEGIFLNETSPANKKTGNQRQVTIEAIPLNTIEPHYLILFTETPRLPTENKNEASDLKNDEKDLRIKKIERQLLQTHEDMRSITEDQEAANEELQSANEELLSSSEELQSLNEELETSKEELQSTNEELTIVNQEMLSLNELVTEEKNYSQAIIATVHDAMIVLDKKFRVKSANHSFYKKFGVTQPETEGEYLYNLGNKQWDIPVLRILLEEIVLKNNQVHDFEVSHKFPKIGKRIMLLNASRILRKNEDEALILLSFNDITEQANAKIKLVEDQKIKVDEKDYFISIASHEMKTPLTTAKAYLQMLEGSLSENNAEALLFAKKASQSINRLNELINELLDISKIRVGKLNYNFTRFDFNEMMQQTVKNLQLTVSTHRFEISGEIEEEITGDKERLQQVVINILSNATKYSPGAQKVYITISKEKDTIKVAVMDTGIGIAKNNLLKIFNPYHRIEEHAVQFQGLGIGLFISNEIILRHQGKMWAESKKGKGSTFYFTLPINSRGDSTVENKRPVLKKSNGK